MSDDSSHPEDPGLLEPGKVQYRYLSSDADYRHLQDRTRYRALHEEVGITPANQLVRWRDEWMRYFQPAPGSRILELGAHNGANLFHYAERGHVVDGVEISSTLMETFDRHLETVPEEVRQRVRMIPGWIEELEPTEPYDYVLCAGVLEQVADPIVVLRVAASALAPHGMLYVSGLATPGGDNTSVRAVMPDDLEHWLLESGFERTAIFVEEGRTFCLARRRDAMEPPHAA